MSSRKMTLIRPIIYCLPGMLLYFPLIFPTGKHFDFYSTDSFSIFSLLQKSPENSAFFYNRVSKRQENYLWLFRKSFQTGHRSVLLLKPQLLGNWERRMSHPRPAWCVHSECFNKGVKMSHCTRNLRIPYQPAGLQWREWARFPQSVRDCGDR